MDYFTKLEWILIIATVILSFGIYNVQTELNAFRKDFVVHSNANYQSFKTDVDYIKSILNDIEINTDKRAQADMAAEDEELSSIAPLVNIK